MICSRLDDVETTIATMNSDVQEIKDTVGQTLNTLQRLESLVDTIMKMIEGLRTSMGAFSKTLYRLLGGGQAGKA